MDMGKTEEWWDSLLKLLFDLQFWMRWKKKPGPAEQGGSNPHADDTGTTREAESVGGYIHEGREEPKRHR